MSTDELPVHFFTIVLNGLPFITYHADVFRQLPFRWHWHIVEGVAKLVHDTAWSVAAGGRIPDEMHDDGRSNDGTSAYLDRLAAALPERVRIYRKPPGLFWDGKREMVAAPLAAIGEPCLLWQVDADEFWRPEQIVAMRRLFAEQPQRTAAYYWCDYFVGPDLLIATRYNYGNNPRQEWLRTWRYRPGLRWRAHEPPTLVEAAPGGGERDLAGVAPFSQDETEAAGARFQHFAYVTEAQLAFKERYYGYHAAVANWRRLQSEGCGSVRLRDYFPWVGDDAMVDSAARCGVSAVAAFDASGGMRIRTAAERDASAAPLPAPRIVLDGVAFQGGERTPLWLDLLRAWRDDGFAEHLVLLDRGGSAPRLPGLHYRSLPDYVDLRSGRDSRLLQRVCDELAADLFVSTGHTAPAATPSVVVALDSATAPPASLERTVCLRHAALILVPSSGVGEALLREVPDCVAPVLLDGAAREAGAAVPALAHALEDRLREAAADSARGRLPRPSAVWHLLRSVQDVEQEERERLLARFARGEAAEPAAGGYLATLQRELREARGTIDDMRKSPFWKLRGRVLRVLAAAGWRRSG